MKKVFFLFCLFTSVLAKAQVNFPDPGLFEEFKSTQTAILLDNTNKVRSKTDMKTLITENWHVTTPIMAPKGSAAKYKKKGYSVLRFERVEKEYNDDHFDTAPNGTMTYHSTTPVILIYTYLKLVMYQENKKGKIEEVLVGWIALGDNVKMTDGLYRNYFQLFNNCIESGLKWAENKHYVNPKISELKNGTLYIPEYALDKYNRNTEEVKKKAINPKKLIKSYDYKAEVVPQADIDAKISSGETVYYVLFLRTANSKQVAIINGATGELMYSHHGRVPNIKTWDIGNMAYAVKYGKADETEEKAGDDDKDDE